MSQKIQKVVSDKIADKTALDLAYREAKKEWISILSEIWTAFGKPVDRNRIQIYAKHLSNVPTGLLEKTIHLAIQKQDYNTPPTIHDILKALKEFLYDPLDLDTAIIGWEEASLNRCILSNFEIDIDYSIPAE